jgi:phosphinothricin acetyltransferase
MVCSSRGYQITAYSIERRSQQLNRNVEHSVHVRRDVRGRGVGEALVAALIVEAAALGRHVMIAGVDAANEGSLRFHEKLGFRRVAHFEQVGCKFGRWLDLVFLQKFLEPAASA